MAQSRRNQTGVDVITHTHKVDTGQQGVVESPVANLLCNWVSTEKFCSFYHQRRIYVPDNGLYPLALMPTLFAVSIRRIGADAVTINAVCEVLFSAKRRF